MDDDKRVYVLRVPKRRKIFIKKLFSKQHQFINSSMETLIYKN